ncbi:MAG: hypothetical protein QM648_06260 [Solirubrobacterales bacterium]
MRDWPEAMFHITGHAIDDMHCFADRRDKGEFLDRFARVVGSEPTRDPVRREPRPWLRPEASLVAYCVLDNHYHVLVRQRVAGGAGRVMRSVLRSYGDYFNKKYGRKKTPVFEPPYGVRRIGSSRQGRRALMYVNLNFEPDPLGYEFSSHGVYVGKRRSSMIDTDSGLWFFGGSQLEYERAIIDEGLPALEQKIAARGPGVRRNPLRYGPGDHILRPQAK